MHHSHEDTSTYGSARFTTGLRRLKLLLLTLLELGSFTPEQLTGSSVHSAEDFCEIGWTGTPLKANTGGIFHPVHLSVVLHLTMNHLGALQRLALKAYVVHCNCS